MARIHIKKDNDHKCHCIKELHRAHEKQEGKMMGSHTVGGFITQSFTRFLPSTAFFCCVRAVANKCSKQCMKGGLYWLICMYYEVIHSTNSVLHGTVCVL